MAGSYISPDIYITWFPSNTGRTVEVYRKYDHNIFVIKMNKKVVAEASGRLLGEWLRALVKPEFHKYISKLEREIIF